MFIILTCAGPQVVAIEAGGNISWPVTFDYWSMYTCLYGDMPHSTAYCIMSVSSWHSVRTCLLASMALALSAHTPLGTTQCLYHEYTLAFRTRIGHA